MRKVQEREREKLGFGKSKVNNQVMQYVLLILYSRRTKRDVINMEVAYNILVQNHTSLYLYAFNPVKEVEVYSSSSS